MEVEKRIESAISRAVWFRNYQRARSRALVGLAQAYPDDYKQLFQIERSIDEQEGKSWVDINGNTRMDISTGTSSGNLTGTQEARATASNDGGEA